MCSAKILQLWIKLFGSFNAYETFRGTVGKLCHGLLKSNAYHAQMHHPNDRKHATLNVRGGASEPRAVRYDTVVEPINELLSVGCSMYP